MLIREMLFNNGTRVHYGAKFGDAHGWKEKCVGDILDIGDGVPNEGRNLSKSPVRVTNEGIPLDSVWESFLLFLCRLAPSKRPRLGRKYIFNMDAHNALHYETS